MSWGTTCDMHDKQKTKNYTVQNTKMSYKENFTKSVNGIEQFFLQKLVMNKYYAVCDVSGNSLYCGPLCGIGAGHMFGNTI